MPYFCVNSSNSTSCFVNKNNKSCIFGLEFCTRVRLAYKSSSKNAKCDRAPCLEARSAIVRAQASERVARVSERVIQRATLRKSLQESFYSVSPHHFPTLEGKGPSFVRSLPQNLFNVEGPARSFGLCWPG